MSIIVFSQMAINSVLDKCVKMFFCIEVSRNLVTTRHSTALYSWLRILYQTSSRLARTYVIQSYSTCRLPLLTSNMADHVFLESGKMINWSTCQVREPKIYVLFFSVRNRSVSLVWELVQITSGYKNLQH